MPNVMKSGSLNILEPSGPQGTCYGTPLQFILDISALSLLLSVTFITVHLRNHSCIQYTCYIQRKKVS